MPDDELLALDEALDRLSELDARAVSTLERTWSFAFEKPFAEEAVL